MNQHKLPLAISIRIHVGADKCSIRLFGYAKNLICITIIIAHMYMHRYCKPNACRSASKLMLLYISIILSTVQYEQIAVLLIPSEFLCG